MYKRLLIVKIMQTYAVTVFLSVIGFRDHYNQEAMIFAAADAEHPGPTNILYSSFRPATSLGLFVCFFVFLNV